MQTSPVITWPAPAEEVPSPDFRVTVAETPVFVYQARVNAAIQNKEAFWTNAQGCAGERASFAIFDMRGPVTVRVTPAKAFTTATVLPERYGITPRIVDGAVEFTLPKPRKVTLLLDDDDRTALHLFAGEPERDAPRADDPNVVYFGPGAYDITGLTLKSGQTLYLAGGAVLRARLPEDAEAVYVEQIKMTYYKGMVINLAQVENVRICGRGIIDSTLIPQPSYPTIRMEGARNILIEGITLRDASCWNVTIAQSEDVEARDLRIVSGRLNSDGINSTNSRRVRIHDNFIRNHDDSIVVKTPEPGQAAEDILVERNTIWNDWGYALGVSYETRAPIRRVTFRENNIIYAANWCLGLHLSDSATVEEITFADTAISKPVADFINRHRPLAMTKGPTLLRAVVTKDMWGKDPERGRIRNITVDGVTLYGTAIPPSELAGIDTEHDIRGVTFRNVRLVGQPPFTELTALRVKQNAFVQDVRVEGGETKE